MAAAGQPLRIALVAGEASGDRLGAGLIRALHRLAPTAEFAGVGGPAMREAGCEIWWAAEELSVMGLIEVLAELPRLLSLRRRLRERILAWRPRVFIGIDAPDFNLGLERRLRRQGIRTVHYVSPSVWAWRRGRVRSIGQAAELVLCLFPMEPPLYAEVGVPARFVGHPLARQLPIVPDRAAARAALDLSLEGTVLAVLPGSRRGEVERLLPVFLAALSRLAVRGLDFTALLPLASEAASAWVEPLVRKSELSPRLRLLQGRSIQAMTAADACLLASGTAALEAMLCKRPMVVAYRLHPLSYALVRALKLLKTPWVSLPNILAGEALVPELLQGACTPEALASALAESLQPNRRERLDERFRALHAALRGEGEEGAASAILELAQWPS
ncbi:MAG: lipid-A-disaccharide synthase [Lysobacterales bacterium]|jgi:lipid-A-disaccharide synthase|nr:MAG: lipid-A-disaccharide synthase [Xanthomonadales bacterium]